MKKMAVTWVDKNESFFKRTHNYKGFKSFKSVTNCRIDTACTGLYTEENNKDYLTENLKYEGRQ